MNPSDMDNDRIHQAAMENSLESALREALQTLFRPEEQEQRPTRSPSAVDLDRRSPPILGAGELDPELPTSRRRPGAPARRPGAPAGAVRPDLGRVENLTRGQQIQLDRMVSEALKSGIADHAIASKPTIQKNIEGATAELVVSISLDLQFFAKWQSDDKLLREAGFLQGIAARSDLPQKIRDRLPKVYAVVKGEERNAYLMEKFPSPQYLSLAKRLQIEGANDAMCRQMISAAFDALFDTYSGTVSGSDRPLLPAIESIYVDRIVDRLGGDGLPEELESLVNLPLLVRSGKTQTKMASCQDMLNEVSRIWPQLAADITPTFVTLVFGDPHPGNILLDTTRSYSGMSEGVKFIDPKEWGEGDYLFDIAKFLHYLEVTFLVEDLEPPLTTLMPTSSVVELSYTLASPSWISHGRQDVEQRIRSFLADEKLKLKDPLWQMRLELGMASNLLGVAGSRYRKQSGSLDAKRVIFAEGVLALERFLVRAKSFIKN